MKNNLIVLTFLIAIACSERKDPPINHVYPRVDYRVVKLYLDTLNISIRAQADTSNGFYTVPYTEIKNGRKHLVFFGTSHVRNLDHPQFRQLIIAFNKHHPQIAFNEGGEVSANTIYESPSVAVDSMGEIGPKTSGIIVISSC